MKKLKSSAREWIFENLLRLIFKFSESHKLVKFVKRPKDDSIYYDIQFKSKVERTELLEAFENYLTNLTNKNVTSERETEDKNSEHLNDAERYSNPLKWRNEGIMPDAVKDRSGNLNPLIISNGYQSIDNWITKEIAEGSVDYMKVYKDHQIKVMKRAIEENGYEIISEVKNGFIIARKDRYTNDPEPINYVHKFAGSLQSNENPAKNDKTVLDKNGLEPDTSGEPIILKPVQGDPSYYVHTLTSSLQTEAESIRTQLSTPDLSKQDFTKDFGVSEDILQNDSYDREQEEIHFNQYIQEQDEKAFQNDFESEIDYNSEEWKQFAKEQNEITDQMPIYESEDLISREMHQFALENSLNRFLDEDPEKYMERVKSAMRSKFTKSSLHPEAVRIPSGFINPLEKYAEELKTYATSEEGMKKIPKAVERDEYLEKYGEPKMIDYFSKNKPNEKESWDPKLSPEENRVIYESLKDKKKRNW